MAEVLGTQAITATLNISDKRVTISSIGTAANGYVDCTGIYNNGKTDGADSLVFYAGGQENVAELGYGESLSITATTTRGDGTSNAKGILVKAPEAPTDRYEEGRRKGWEEAASKFYRDGDYVYGPGSSLNTNTYYKATATLTGHSYTASSASPGPYQGTYIDYKASSHSEGTLGISWNK